MTAVEKYLRQWAEPEADQLTGFPDLTWKHCLTIPAYREDDEFIARLKSGILQSNRCLLILVINQPEGLPELSAENQLLKERILTSAPVSWRQDHLSLHALPATNSHILLVDRFTHRTIPYKYGVGMARKIAGDIALSLIDKKHVQAPWIFCTDADTTLPSNYFQAFDITGPAAFVFPFRHLCQDNPLGLATRLYEQALHHYVKGLKRAGSPYAFHTIGSTLAISSEHYAQVRGFPKKAGGEDFYLLNKLAKTGPVVTLAAPIVEIKARHSDRVPFGTGPAVDKILNLEYPDKEYLVYNPLIFDELKQWLQLIPKLWECPSSLEGLSQETRFALAELGVQKAIDHSKSHSKSQTAFCKQMHIWFDGFLTLKFIHGLQRCVPPVPLSGLIEKSKSAKVD